MANAAWLSFDRFDLALNIRRATVTAGYETVFEFDANFKRIVKIRSPTRAQAAVAARHVSNASPLMSWRPALDQRPRAKNPSCSRQYKFKPPKESPICIGSSDP
jgi:hypothetical protein